MSCPPMRDRARWSAPPGRPPSAAWWSCRSPTGRAARRTALLGTSRSRSSTAVNAPNSLVSAAAAGRRASASGRPAPSVDLRRRQPPVTSDRTLLRSLLGLLVVERHEVLGAWPASSVVGEDQLVVDQRAGRSSPSPAWRPRPGRCSSPRRRASRRPRARSSSSISSSAFALCVGLVRAPACCRSTATGPPPARRT